MLRINPYLQQPSSDGMYITWFTEENIPGELSITGPGLDSPLTITTTPTLESSLSYTNAELNQEIEGLEQGSWLLGDENYKHTVDLSDLSPESTYEYSVTVGETTFESSFETAPTAEDWDAIRFVVLSDSETEPRGRVNRRDWQQGALAADSLSRPGVEDSQWAETIGVSGDRLNYPLTENVGYANNLEIINSRNPDFMVMPGDLIQGGGYQPAWDEFFRHNAGEFDSGLSEYPLLPALGNWENFGALNGGYGLDEDGRYGPLYGRQKHDVYFDAPSNGTPEHQDNYYRTDYGPVTILTLDSSNGEPDDNRDNYGEEGQPPKISGREYTGPGTDTQENITREQYEAAGGTDLSDFNPGSPQWNWVIEQLEAARAEGQIIFAQFHHAPYSSGTHGLPMNHEDSSGQGGTPMRQYQSLFEEYGVVAVFSGHSEMFERSFVDENNDGEGVYYYDVGVAGDGMRGQRTDEDGNLLGYNQFSQWTADQSEPELWQEVDGTLQNVAGGKHYGHLEVNLERTGENPGEADGTRITFTPVYSFPVLDANYDLVDTERRVYGDEIVIDVAGPTGVDRIFGTERADNIVGTDADEIIFGGALRDRIDGGAGDDQIFGEAGRDVIMGGDGDDLVNGGLLNNNVFGDAGSDTFVLVVGGDTRIRDFTVGEDKIGLMDGVSFGQLSIEKRGQNALISVDDEIALRVMNTAVDALTESVFVAV
ncbi:MAG: metallophosphoesterase [Cyanobacteria bacterium J06621_11]